jgi:hypothetical protein
VDSDSFLEPRDFLGNSLNAPVFTPRRVLDPAVGSETRKLADRRMVWLAFYRRASNDRAVDPPHFGGPPANYAVVSRGDPLLYEFIVVVVRRTTANHRFARQNVSGSGNAPFLNPTAMTPGSNDPNLTPDRLIPEPWLITFDPTSMTPAQVPWPPPPNADGYTIDARPAGSPQNLHGDRFLTNNFTHKARLNWVIPAAQQNIARLLPVDSVLIPAVNDNDAFRQWEDDTAPPGSKSTPMAYPLLRQVGFVPSDPDTLPIYKVVDRVEDASGSTTIVLEGNGVYPWHGNVPELQYGTPPYFLCWVIPPAFTERDASGQPVFERRSPIVTVARRTFRVPEIVNP